MRIVKNNTTGATGLTVGRRKDGSVAVMYDHDDSIHWFSSEMFGSWFEEI